MSALSAVIFDCEGESLSAQEKAFFRDVNPFGYILFARNCSHPEQVRRLTGELCELSGRDTLPILIDQEGGRVARLKPPHWRAYPPGALFDLLARQNLEAARSAIYLNARLIAQELHELGITVDCAPLADVPVPGAHDVIGDRAFGNTPAQVAELAGEMSRGLMDGGIVPVLKHIPGHGRALSDSHLELPVVDAPLSELRRTDFLPFQALKNLPMGMTAHVVYTSIDAQRMATLSPAVIGLIREEIGFDGLLLSDDIGMKALNGDFAARASQTLAAGCDIVLHCNGSLAERMRAAGGVGPLEGEAARRAERAMASVAKRPEPFETSDLLMQRDALLSQVVS